jgi:ubiquitin-conjugating enzyme E2 D/E
MRIILILERVLESTPTNFVSLAPIGDDLMQLLGRIEGPPGSPYEGGLFHVQISILDDFPFSPPSCRFLTKIFHPNIDYAGKICLDFLEPQNWRMELIYLESILLSICALLDQPNVDDPLVPEIAATYIENESKFNQIARQYTAQFAHEHVAIRTSNVAASPGAAPGWQSIFLEDRRRVIQTRTAQLIGWLERGPDTPDSSQLSSEVITSYTHLLHQLSLQLAGLNADDASDRVSRFQGLTVKQCERFESFFDACVTEFLNLADDPVWRRCFPQIETLRQNDTTRGTGTGYVSLSVLRP